MRRADRGSDPANEFVKTIDIKNRDGQVVERKEVVTAKGLLHLAHKERLSKIKTRLIQAPTKENGENAIAVVLVVTSRGAFTGLGDANPRNVQSRVAPHFIRMAETRALARALRAALDIGQVAIEELEEDVAFVDSRPVDTRPEPSRESAQGAPDAAPAPAPERRGPDGPSPRSAPGYDRGGGPSDGTMTDPQRRMLYRIAFDKGHEGDSARTWLHEELGVESLSTVTKRQASAFIDRNLQKSGGNGQAQAG